MDSVSDENVEKILAEKEKKEQTRAALERSSVETIWRSELATILEPKVSQKRKPPSKFLKV